MYQIFYITHLWYLYCVIYIYIYDITNILQISFNFVYTLSRYAAYFILKLPRKIMKKVLQVNIFVFFKSLSHVVHNRTFQFTSVFGTPQIYFFLFVLFVFSNSSSTVTLPILKFSTAYRTVRVSIVLVKFYSPNIYYSMYIGIKLYI